MASVERYEELKRHLFFPSLLTSVTLLCYFARKAAQSLPFGNACCCAWECLCCPILWSLLFTLAMQSISAFLLFIFPFRQRLQRQCPIYQYRHHHQYYQLYLQKNAKNGGNRAKLTIWGWIPLTTSRRNLIPTFSRNACQNSGEARTCSRTNS